MFKEENCPLSLVGSGLEWWGIFLKVLIVYDDAGFETWERERREDGQSADDGNFSYQAQRMHQVPHHRGAGGVA